MGFQSRYKESIYQNNQLSVNREQVCKQCEVLERVIDTVKVIGVSYRGTNSEAVYILLDEVIGLRVEKNQNYKSNIIVLLYCRFQAENNKGSSSNNKKN